MGRLFGRARSILQGCCLLMMLSSRFYGSCMKLISFMNCCHWTIVLVPIWTCWTLHSYLKGKSWFHSVFLAIHLDLSPSHQKIVVWLQTTLKSASSLSLPYFLSWNHEKVTNLWYLVFHLTTFAISLKGLQWTWRIILWDIIVNNFTTILDVLLRFPTASLRWIIFSFRMYLFYFSSNLLKSCVAWNLTSHEGVLHWFLRSQLWTEAFGSLVSFIHVPYFSYLWPMCLSLQISSRSSTSSHPVTWCGCLFPFLQKD